MHLKVGRYENGQLVEMAKAEIVAVRQNTAAIKLISKRRNYSARLGDLIIQEGVVSPPDERRKETRGQEPNNASSYREAESAPATA